ncbi:MAG: threonine synthase [Candidatus Fermentithermobacillus carboniphilus]|uniref:Threonine synthase n=1 Tax=Candidatus Fermentithermobacillus carboniphilus TaxID=3085328 RepID=A0AAT9LD47_9FIRM|nr:MAG: threonine synthase [Candidatus Fermentithermobacillus carboniphilus]
MSKIFELQCVLCGKRYREGEVEYTCPSCGMDGTLDVLYDYDVARKAISREALAQNRDYSLWRYWPILPVHERDHVPPLSVGWTPLYESDRLAAQYGVKRLFIKDDGRNPTGSLKDRASAIAVGRALDLGRKEVSCSSTGNAASSLAGFCTVASLRSTIFVPESAPEAKVTQLLVYGARVVLVKGDYNDAFNLSEKAIERFGWYNRNCAINPYLVEGKKTCGLEVAEQLGWEVPDYLFVAVGDGCIISSFYKAFHDLIKLGITDRMPRIVGVQAEGCKPLVEAVKRGEFRVKAFEKADTIADSIAVRRPRNWAKALRAVRESQGTMVSVSDGEILSAIRELACNTGVFAEPAGAASFAGFRKMALSGQLRQDETAVVVVTGNGLKDISSARKAVGDPIVSPPDIEAFVRILSRVKGLA